MLVLCSPCKWVLLHIIYLSVCVCFLNTGQFKKGVAEGVIDPSFNPVSALRLSVVKDSAVWAILSEVRQWYNTHELVLSNQKMVV